MSGFFKSLSFSLCFLLTAPALAEEIMPITPMPQSLNTVAPQAGIMTQPAPAYPNAAMGKNTQLLRNHMQTAARMPVAPMPSGEVKWLANRGSSLKNVLQAWSQIANVDMVWQAPGDVTLMKSIDCEGSFEDALDKLFTTMSESGYSDAPYGRFYNDPLTQTKTLFVMGDS